MNEQEILEAMEKGLSGVGTQIGEKLEAQLAEFNETAKKVLVPKAEDVKTAEEVKAALEEAGAMAGINRIEVWDIPVGQALVGGFTAVFASELVDGFMAKQGDMARGVVKLIGAGAAVKWGGRILGSTGSKALAILLAYDGVRTLIPIDRYARQGATAVTGVVTTRGLGGFKRDTGGVVKGGVVEQASQVASDYYGKAFGR